MKVLVHTCCAGCAIYTINTLEHKLGRVTGFFSNPNIHPYTEYQKREKALKSFASKHKKEIVFDDYAPEGFFQEINYKETKGERCPICWKMRLKRAAEFAKANSYNAFTTTLLISPYQEHFVVKIIGEEVAKETEVPFYYEDFRTGFRDSQQSLKKEGLYSQKYCGCIYSERERFEKTSLSSTESGAKRKKEKTKTAS